MAYFKSIAVVIVALVACSQLNAQSLKDALYGGKLKTDSGQVIKKGDSLSLRTDAEQKARLDSVKTAQVIKKQEQAAKDSVARANGIVPAAGETASVNAVDGTGTPANVSLTPADNNRVWKKFVDDYSAIIKAEVIPNKKIKSGAYSVLIEYEIAPDGSVTTNSVSASPENSYLVEQIKIRMMLNTPQLAPPAITAGKPKRIVKKQMLTFIKEKD